MILRSAMLQWFLLVIFAHSLLHYAVGNCPCEPAPNLRYNETTLTICVKNFPVQPFAFAQGHVINVESTDNNKCTVIIETWKTEMRSALADRTLCPDVCGVLPTAYIPEPILEAFNSTQDLATYREFALTCSLTVQMVLRKLRHEQSAMSQLQNLIIDVARRRILECNEHPRSEQQHHRYQDHSEINRRKVKAVVIWVGSTGNMKLMQQQSTVLQKEPHHGTDAVVGWAATDALYGCTKEEAVCHGHNGRYKFLPNTNINSMSTGWGCAQRRPLRALAHVLKLYDPQFIISLDDDSFCNYPLLMERYGSLIMDRLRVEPLYLGEFAGKTGTAGHLTTSGLFVGGAGYILGNRILTRLVRKEAHAYGYETWPGHSVYAARERDILLLGADTHRTAEQIRHLSVITEGAELAAQHCPALPKPNAAGLTAGQSVADLTDTTTDHNSCVLSLSPRPAQGRTISRHNAVSSGSHSSTPVLHGDKQAVKYSPDEGYKVVPLAVRLVDFCVNIMAAAHTCQHSDHSLGRCLVYGAHATPLGLTCHAASPDIEIRPEMLVGMCMVTPACNLTEQVTCHRYKPTWTGRGANAVMGAVRTTHRRAYYRDYSTLYDPKFIGIAS